MLVELSMVEQRYLAVREVLDTGASITHVATPYGVDRRTLHRWLVRYANGDLPASSNAIHADRSQLLPSRPGGNAAAILPRKFCRLSFPRPSPALLNLLDW
jgi:hypothetical protein